MLMLKGAILALSMSTAQAFAAPVAIPAEAVVNNKVVISVDASGTVEYQRADGTFQAAQVVSAEEASSSGLIQKAYYVRRGYGWGAPGQGYGAPPPLYYDQGNLYQNPCNCGGYFPPPQPRVRVRRTHERDTYEYDVIPQGPGGYYNGPAEGSFDGY